MAHIFPLKSFPEWSRTCIWSRSCYYSRHYLDVLNCVTLYRLPLDYCHHHISVGVPPMCKFTGVIYLHVLLNQTTVWPDASWTSFGHSIHSFSYWHTLYTMACLIFFSIDWNLNNIHLKDNFIILNALYTLKSCLILRLQ